GGVSLPVASNQEESMRLRFAYVAFCLSCLAVAGLARAQSENPAESANPPQNPTPTGPADPSDGKQPPAPHKPFDFTVYGRSNDTINPANTAVTGALASRNSYVGIATPFGALKLGKNDTPYKSVTADFDFLADTPGDYNSIMGNTGGDNRTEFDARFPHAVWYESPDVMGFRFNAIWSPGQNRVDDN